ncbi:hypothetical protein ACHAXR_001830 [Thalassiosira sp. AJA248-18]
MADKRVTMIKPVVGKVKSPAYALPDNDFVYGIESKLDKEGAGEVVQSWAQSKSSEPPCSMQSFPATNRQALKNGCLTSKAQREYGKQFPVMKQNPKQSNKKSQNSEEDLQKNSKIGEVITSIYQENTQPHQPPQAFGIKSKKNKVSMTELLRIPTELDDETDYPDLSNKKRKGRLPPAKATKSSLIVAKCRELPSEDEMARRKSVKEFKMTKFKNVQPRVKCYM